MKRSFLLIAAALATACSLAQPALADTWGHNGSDVDLTAEHGRIVIVYDYVRPGMQGLVASGTLLFAGRYDLNGNVSGTAYVFKKNCPPAAYSVHGGFRMGSQSLHLEGKAPIRGKYSCAVVGYTWNSGNASLDFENVSED